MPWSGLELEDFPNAPVVSLTSGAVRGSGSDVLSFNAIQYALAPVGRKFRLFAWCLN